MRASMEATEASRAAIVVVLVVPVSSVARLDALNGDIAVWDTVSRVYLDVVETTSGGLRFPG